MTDRSEVITKIADLPIRIEVQRAYGKWYAILPAYRLPLDILAHGATQEEAQENLKARVREMWGGV